MIKEYVEMLEPFLVGLHWLVETSSSRWVRYAAKIQHIQSKAPCIGFDKSESVASFPIVLSLVALDTAAPHSKRKTLETPVSGIRPRALFNLDFRPHEYNPWITDQRILYTFVVFRVTIFGTRAGDMRPMAMRCGRSKCIGLILVAGVKALSIRAGVMRSKEGDGFDQGF